MGLEMDPGGDYLHHHSVFGNGELSYGLCCANFQNECMSDNQVSNFTFGSQPKLRALWN